MLYFHHNLYENTLLGVCGRRRPTDHSIYYLPIFNVFKPEKNIAIICMNEIFLLYNYVYYYLTTCLLSRDKE